MLKALLSLFYVFFVVVVVFCSNMFLYISTGYTSSLRDWMQLYLKIQAFLSSYLPFMFHRRRKHGGDGGDGGHGPLVKESTGAWPPCPMR